MNKQITCPVCRAILTGSGDANRLYVRPPHLGGSFAIAYRGVADGHAIYGDATRVWPNIVNLCWTMPIHRPAAKEEVTRLATHAQRHHAAGDWRTMDAFDHTIERIEAQ